MSAKTMSAKIRAFNSNCKTPARRYPTEHSVVNRRGEQSFSSSSVPSGPPKGPLGATLLVLSCAVALLVLTGCGVPPNTGNGGAGGGPVGGQPPGGGGIITSQWPEDDESVQGVVMHTQPLSTSQCLLNPNGAFAVTQTTAFLATTWAQHSATFWALDPNDAQLCQSGQAFQGVLLAQRGQAGLLPLSLSPGTYYLAIQDMGNSSNAGGVEIDVSGGPSGRTYVGPPFATVTGSFNPGGWRTMAFTIQANTAVWLDGGNSGGLMYMMTPSQAQAFQSTYAAGYFGGTINFINDASNNPNYCGFNGSSTADAPEDCDLTSHLVPGSYVLVYINNTSSEQWLTAWGLVYQ